MSVLKGIGLAILAVVVLLGIGWVAQGSNFFLYKVFAPKYETTRRQTFEQSHAYRQGMIQELQNMQFVYVRASPEHRAGLASIILRRVGDVPDPESLPADIRAFVACARSSQAEGDFSASCAAG